MKPKVVVFKRDDLCFHHTFTDLNDMLAACVKARADGFKIKSFTAKETSCTQQGVFVQTTSSSPRS
jgi:hypothetical protein